MAVETSADLHTQLKDEIGFDVSDTVLLGWLNAKHRRMVARSKCKRGKVAVSGGTVVDQAGYTVPPEIIEIQSVFIDDAEFTRTSRRSIPAVLAATAVFVGPGGVVAQDATSASVEQLVLYPTPTEAALTIEVFGPVRAKELQVTGVVGTTNTPDVPAEFFEALVHGAAAVGMKRDEERTADAREYEAEFNAATEELRRQVRRRWNTGPARIEVVRP